MPQNILFADISLKNRFCDTDIHKPFARKPAQTQYFFSSIRTASCLVVVAGKPCVEVSDMNCDEKCDFHVAEDNAFYLFVALLSRSIPVGKAKQVMPAHVIAVVIGNT